MHMCLYEHKYVSVCLNFISCKFHCYMKIYSKIGGKSGRYKSLKLNLGFRKNLFKKYVGKYLLKVRFS